MTSHESGASPVAERTVPTKLAAFAAALVEHACLAALLAAPLYLNLHSQRVFEEDKVPLLRALSLVVLVGLLIWLSERRGAARSVRPSTWRVPLVRPALALAAVYGISTLASTTPLNSLIGGYHRLQGAYTFASYLPFFFAPILLGFSARRAERLVSVVLLGSLPVSLYALVQYFGYDPMPWGATFGKRVYSTAGNPIFLGAYLILVIPLTVARVLERARSAWLPPLGYLALLLLQTGALVLAQSRGPFVGLGVGLAVFALTGTALYDKRKAFLLVAAAVVPGIVLAIVLGLPGSASDGGFARLFDVVNVRAGSGKVRSLIWQASSDLILASGPARLLIGYGPAAELTALTPHYPPELGQYEKRRVIPDRAHNEAIDATVATGVLGCAAEFLFFIAFFSCVLRSLGLIRGKREGAAFALLLAGAGAAGVLLPYGIDGSLRFSGLGLHAGIIAGLLVFLAGRALLWPRGASPARGSADLLLVGLLAAMAAHLVEIGLGIAVCAPRLYSWTYAGLAAALAARRQGEREPIGPAQGTDPALASMAGFVLVLLSVDFYTPAAKRAGIVLLLLAVCLPTWLGGALLLQNWTGGWRNRLTALARYAAVTLLPWMSFAAVLLWWLGWQPSPSTDTAAFAVRFASHVAHVVSLVYAAAVALVVCAALLATAAARPLPAHFVRSPWHVVFYSLLALAAGALIVNDNLAVSRADVIAKQATFYEQRRRFDLAAALVEEAIRLRPSVDRYYSDLGRENLEVAKAAWREDPARAREHLLRAEAALERARETLPPLLDHTRNLARLHRAWVNLSADPGESAAHRARADEFYSKAAVLAPTSAPVLNEQALMHFEKDDHRRARDLLDRSLGIDGRYATTFWLRANLRAAGGDLEGALEDYDRALAIDSNLRAALSGKGGVLAQLGRLDEAIEVNRKVLFYFPKDLISRRNLAVLFREKGDLQNAIEWANRAREVSPENERPALDTFIAELEAAAPDQGTQESP